MVSMAFDVDGDGQADYVLSGVDHDGDGIPDGLDGSTERRRLKELLLGQQLEAAKQSLVVVQQQLADAEQSRAAQAVQITQLEAQLVQLGGD